VRRCTGRPRLPEPPCPVCCLAGDPHVIRVQRRVNVTLVRDGHPQVAGLEDAVTPNPVVRVCEVVDTAVPPWRSGSTIGEELTRNSATAADSPPAFGMDDDGDGRTGRSAQPAIGAAPAADPGYSDLDQWRHRPGGKRDGVHFARQVRTERPRVPPRRTRLRSGPRPSGLRLCSAWPASEVPASDAVDPTARC
jgi:hypothetical protein